MAARITRLLRNTLFGTALVTVPVVALAQDATITGTITDATGGVLPGVTGERRGRTRKSGFRSVLRISSLGFRLYAWRS